MAIDTRPWGLKNHQATPHLDVTITLLVPVKPELVGGLLVSPSISHVCTLLCWR